MILNHVLDSVGNTPLLRLPMPGQELLDVKVKLEHFNPTGSVKDRAASFILSYLLDTNVINKQTTIIESSSGNFGVSVAAFCKRIGLKFICVVDPNISIVNEDLLNAFGAKVIKVTDADSKGGYLLTRVRKVKQLRNAIDNSYWINQYENFNNAFAYQSIGKEIFQEIDVLDYLFVGVGSGGTITGVSNSIKRFFPKVKVVAVDSVGSVIFGGEAKKRYVPGVGSSLRPKVLNKAKIDEVIWIEEHFTVQMCHEILDHYSLLVGGSSGTVYAAIKKYFMGKPILRPTSVVAIFPDDGNKYLSTVYNKEWCDKIFKSRQETEPHRKTLTVSV